MRRLLDVALQSNTRSSVLYTQNKEPKSMRQYLTSASSQPDARLDMLKKQWLTRSGAEEVPGWGNREPRDDLMRTGLYVSSTAFVWRDPQDIARWSLST